MNRGQVFPRRKTMSEGNDEGGAPRPRLAPADFFDPVIEAYKKDVDRTLLRENLKLTYEERIEKAECVHNSVALARGAARHALPARDENEAT
jgi:hypothetical protein